MKIHEFQGKQLFKKFGVPVLKGIAVKTAEQAEAAAKELGSPVIVVKSQIHAGGRGKGTVYADEAMTKKRGKDADSEGDDEELEAVEGVKARGEANGVEGLAMISRAAALAMEPALACALQALGRLSGDTTGFLGGQRSLLQDGGQ